MDVDLGLYAILDPDVAGGRTLTDLAERVAAWATLVQLRDKHSSTRAMVEEAREIQNVLAAAGVPFLVNDRVDVALAAEADGVHIGQDDLAPSDARLLLGRRAIIGLSVSTLHQARAAPLELLDYVGVGAVFATGSKADANAPMGIGGLREIVQAIRERAPKFPICGISGIDAGNAGEVIGAGCDGVAVISALSLAPDPALAAQGLRAAVDRARAQRSGR